MQCLFVRIHIGQTKMPARSKIVPTLYMFTFVAHNIENTKSCSDPYRTMDDNNTLNTCIKMFKAFPDK